MRIFRLLTVVFVLCGYARAAMPACNLAGPIYESSVSGEVPCYIDNYEQNLNCADAEHYVCGNGTAAFYHCRGSCLDGYTKKTATQPLPNGVSVTYCDCELTLTPISTCPPECPDTEWTWISGTNIEKRCVLSKGSGSCEYQCVAGYYGSPTSASGTCTPCPDTTKTYKNSNLKTLVSGTSENGTSSLRDCYAPGGTTYYQAAGAFKCSSDAYYDAFATGDIL